MGYAPTTMQDITQQQKEWFSRAFLVAVSAAAGYSLDWKLDDVNGVDVTVADGGITVDWQMKATASPDFSQDHLRFDLDRGTYKQLVEDDRSSEAYLGVVVIPDDPSLWVKQSAEDLTLLKCGYWARLTGLEPTDNTSSVRIKLPLSNMLSVHSMTEIMTQARRRLTRD